MTSPAPAAPAGDGIFSWPGALRLRWPIVGFLLLSLALHVGTFILFQVVSPVRLTLLPDAAPILLLNAGTPEGKALLAWAEAEDPGLGAAPARALPPDLAEPRYTPSYRTPRTAPRTVAIPQENATAAPGVLPHEWERRLEAAPPAAEPAPAYAVASLDLGGALLGRAIVEQPALSIRTGASANACTYLLGVNTEGAVEFLFLQRGSDQPEVDSAVRAMLRGVKFSPATEFAWGFVTVVGL